MTNDTHVTLNVQVSTSQYLASHGSVWPEWYSVQVSYCLLLGSSLRKAGMSKYDYLQTDLIFVTKSKHGKPPTGYYLRPVSRNAIICIGLICGKRAHVVVQKLSRRFHKWVLAGTKTFAAFLYSTRQPQDALQSESTSQIASTDRLIMYDVA